MIKQLGGATAYSVNSLCGRGKRSFSSASLRGFLSDVSQIYHYVTPIGSAVWVNLSFLAPSKAEVCLLVGNGYGNEEFLVSIFCSTHGLERKATETG